MTTIAWDGKILAADKRMVNNWLAKTTTKLWQHNGLILAVSGDFDVGLSMKRWVLGGRELSDFPEKQKHKDTYATTIVVEGGILWLYETTPDPLRFEDSYAAFGSGRDFAISALALGKNAIEAVEFAAQFDLGTGNGVDWAAAEIGKEMK